MIKFLKLIIIFFFLINYFSIQVSFSQTDHLGIFSLLKNKNNLEECFNKSLECAQNEFKRENYEKSFSILTHRMNELNEMLSIEFLALHYRVGYGTYRDSKKAFKLYKRSSDMGSISALVNLGYCYEYGIGISKNIEKAIEYYSSAAETGSAAGLYLMGLIYKSGKGVMVNFTKANEYFIKAEKKGSLRAKTELGFSYEYGHGVKKNLIKSERFFQEASEENEVIALNQLGYNYYKGIYGNKNLSKAFNYWKRSADLNNPYGLFMVGKMYLDGEHVFKNNEKAYDYTRRSANLNFADAYNNLGYMYEVGIFVKKHMKTAIKLYKIAAKMGSEVAQSNLIKLKEHWHDVSAKNVLNQEKGLLGVQLKINNFSLKLPTKMPIYKHNVYTHIYNYKNKGVIISKVFKSGPSFNKLKKNDIILKVDGYLVDTPSFVVNLIQEKNSCDQIDLTIFRKRPLYIYKTIILGSLKTKQLCNKIINKVVKKQYKLNNKVIKNDNNFIAKQAELEKERAKRLEEQRKREDLEQKLVSLEQEKQKRIELEKKLTALQSENNKQKQKTKQIEIGSGFYVSKFRHIVTNQHVVNQCKKITVGDSMSTQITSDLIASDKKNDLAILQTISMEMASTDTKSFIENLSIQIVPIVSGGLIRAEDVIGGEEIFVAGYPLGNMVSDSMRLVQGLVNATKGYENDITQFETDASIKKGNSGGPIYDTKGNIVGIAVKRLNVSQSDNFNFAIKGTTVKQFLDAHGVITSLANRKSQLSSTEIYKIASKQTVMVVCHR